MKATCQACEGECHWIAAPTGGWWAHDLHPADDHEAAPHSRAEVVRILSENLGDTGAEELLAQYEAAGVKVSLPVRSRPAMIPDWALNLVSAVQQHENEHGKGAPCLYDLLSLVPIDIREISNAVPAPGPDTFPEWLQQRYGHTLVDGDDFAAHVSFWQHEADAVRRAMARGGFKPVTSPLGPTRATRRVMEQGRVEFESNTVELDRDGRFSIELPTSDRLSVAEHGHCSHYTEAKADAEDNCCGCGALKPAVGRLSQEEQEASGDC